MIATPWIDDFGPLPDRATTDPNSAMNPGGALTATAMGVVLRVGHITVMDLSGTGAAAVRNSGVVRDAVVRLDYVEAARRLPAAAERLLDANLASLERAAWPGASLRFHFEAATFASSQRTLLREQMQLRLTAFGRRFSDWAEKPARSVAGRLRGKMAEGLEFEQACRAVIRGAGRSRGWVNGVAVVARKLDKGLIGLAVAFSVGRVAYNAVYDSAKVWDVLFEEGFSWAGASAGCAVGAALGTEIPLVGNAAGCVIGSIGGGLGASHYATDIAHGISHASDAIGDALDPPAGAFPFPQLIWIP